MLRESWNWSPIWCWGWLVPGVGVNPFAVGGVPGDRVHRVGADPVPGDVLAGFDLDRGIGPAVVADRDPAIGGATGGGEDQQGEHGRNQGRPEHPSGAHPTRYQPFIP